MSSSSPRRPRALVAAALAAVAAALVWTGAAGAAGAAAALDVVAVVPSADGVTMVVGVDPPPSLAQPGTFSVASGDSGKLPTTAWPVLGPQLATAVVLDTSADGAGTLQGGINGTTNLLLQLPDGVHNLVVADGGDGPQVLSPLDQGATEAVGALNSARAGGTRHTAAAIDAALAAVPAGSGRSRLLLLYTGATDAGGEPAGQLGRRLAESGVVLAVVTTGDQRYWADAAAVTGGVVEAAGPDGSLRAFDRVASVLRGRFVLAFPRPATLPATVRVSMTVGGQTVTQSAMVPEVVAETAPEGEDGFGPATLWWAIGAVVLLGLVAAPLLLVRRRGAAGSPPDSVVVRHGDPRPRRVRAGGAAADPAADPATSAAAESAADPATRAAAESAAGPATSGPATARDALGTQDTGINGATPGRSPADGSASTPGRSPADGSAAKPAPSPAGDRPPAQNAAAPRPAAQGAPTEHPSAAEERAARAAAERAGVGGTVGDPAGAQPGAGAPLPRRKPGAAGARQARTPDPAAEKTVEIARPSPTPRHPAADERAFLRLDEETSRVAAAVAAGQMEFRQAVARIAMAAPGRVDLLDRVIETERRLAGVQIGNSPPSEVTLKLLTTARRVVAGEVALVGPKGVRVEQASTGLRLIHPDRTTREYRSATELARHLDLDTLSVDAPTS